MVTYDNHSSSNAPVRDIFQFLMFTGARLREVLHMEWEDVNFETCVWHIKEKPNCPTKDKLGWSPKWGNERDVPLFPEALDILKAQPQRQNITGVVLIRDAENNIVDRKTYPANFIFPKQEIVKTDSERIVRFTRVDSISKAWRTMKRKAGIENLQLKDLRTYFDNVLAFRGCSTLVFPYFFNCLKVASHSSLQTTT